MINDKTCTAVLLGTHKKTVILADQDVANSQLVISLSKQDRVNALAGSVTKSDW